MIADEPERIDLGTLDLTKLCLCGHDVEEHTDDPQQICEQEQCYCVAFRSLGRTGLIERSHPVVLATPERPLYWPISKCKGENLDTWEFVEEFRGRYEDAMARARALQGSKDAEWQYRIWDCR